jgi:hypothetical protein
VKLRDETSEEIFQRLDGRSGGSGLEARDTDLELGAGKLAHAVENGRRLLLLPLGPDDPAVQDDDSQGVTLTERTLIDAGHPVRFQAVVCELPELAEQFGLVCDELWDALTEDPTAPAETARAVLERWRDLLAPRRTRLLAANALSGLLAELHVVERLAEALGCTEALRAWTGPEGARFDFMGSGGAVEVKSTTHRARFLVQIHGLSQLEPPEGGHLLLFAEQVERVPAGGDSVPDAVDRLLAAGCGARELFDRLAKLGYDARDASAYRVVRFELLREVAVAVDGDASCLTRDRLKQASLADRLFNVSYSVDLSGYPAEDSTVVAGRIVDTLGSL